MRRFSLNLGSLGPVLAAKQFATGNFRSIWGRFWPYHGHLSSFGKKAQDSSQPILWDGFPWIWEVWGWYWLQNNLPQAILGLIGAVFDRTWALFERLQKGPGINWSHHWRMYSESLENFGMITAPKKGAMGRFSPFRGAFWARPGALFERLQKGPGINWNHHWRMFSESLEQFGMITAPKKGATGSFSPFQWCY